MLDSEVYEAAVPSKAPAVRVISVKYPGGTFADLREKAKKTGAFTPF